jgi:hypothetical protein
LLCYGHETTIRFNIIKINTKETTSGKDTQDASQGAKGGQNNAHKRRSVVQKAKFEGQCKDLDGHVTQYLRAQQANQFMKTTEEIGLYVGQHCLYGGYIGTAVQLLDKPLIVSPANPPAEATMADRKQ